jgi:NADP-dependent 3-hydroxy acid dehydrogenase YdfG
VNEVPSKLALITGASKGIGRATALTLANEDLHLFLTARNQDQLQSLSDEIKEVGGTSTIYVADLRNAGDINDLIGAIRSIKLNLSLLVHSAGIARIGMVSQMSPSDWEEALQVNLTIPFVITQHCLPLMKRGSKIIFINSVAGKATFSEWAAYCASKHGLRALADTLRQEVQPLGISVTSIYPASVDTPMQDHLPYDWDRTKMLDPMNVAFSIAHVFNQPSDVSIKEIDLENNSGTF